MGLTALVMSSYGEDGCTRAYRVLVPLTSLEAALGSRVLTTGPPGDICSYDLTRLPLLVSL